jgi:hypothetical protein
MFVILIVFEAICGILLGIILYKFYKKQKRKRMVSSWQIGDFIRFKEKLTLKGKSIEYSEIIGWNLDNVFIEFSDNTYAIQYDLIECNQSYNWRKHYEDCEKIMGEKPLFNPLVNIASDDKKHSKIDDKPIELLTETECQIYLKQCLEKEDYETAELIKKQMEKYR